MNDASPPAPVPPDRRLAAILFVDLVGYSALAARDEHRAMSLLTLFHTCARDAITGCGGTLIKTVGDAVFAEFGSAERAVRCGLRLRHEIPARAWAEQIPAQLRAGVHLGDVVTSGDGDLYGDGVNIAARLQREAAPNQVLVSEAVWQQLRQRREYRFAPVGEKVLKGQPGPVRLYSARIADPDLAADPMPHRRWLHGRLTAGTVGLVLAVLGLGITGGLLLRGAGEGAGAAEDAVRPVRLSVALPDSAPLAFVGSAALGIGRTALALSPDGRLLAYVGLGPDDSTRIYLRRLDEFAVQPLSGTAGAYAPFFSPDGRWIGFFADEKLKKVDVTGSESVILADASRAVGGTWWGRDRILFVSREGRRLNWISASGGTVTDLAWSPREQWPILAAPAVFPDPQHVLLTVPGQTVAYTPATGAVKPVLPNAADARYALGRLIFGRGTDLLAVPFDVERLEVRGEPERIASGVRFESVASRQFAVATNGVLAYAPGVPASVGVLGWADRSGVWEPLPFPPERFSQLSVSPDGRSAAVGVFGAGVDVWIYALESGTRYRLTQGGGNFPVWSYDGSAIYFSSDRDGNADVYATSVQGAAGTRRVINTPATEWPYSHAPDGSLLYQRSATPRGDLMLLPAGSSGDEGVQVGDPEASEGLGKLSPDGRWLAYTSDLTGSAQVYVQPLDDPGARIIVSADGGEEPVWSRSGEELFFRNRQTLMRVPLTLRGSALEHDIAQPVFTVPDWINLGGYSYDISPDGRRFLLVRATGDPTARQIHVVQGWVAAR